MTITDIAKAANVSVATVSRFFNNGPIKEETKKKLEKVILDLNYVPESFTHEIVNSQNTAIAVITHSATNNFSTEFIEETMNRYNERNIVCYTGYSTNAQTEYRYIMDIISRKVSGIILYEPAEGYAQIELYNRLYQRMPLVVVHSFPANFECNSITVDQEKGMKDAMQFLLNTGHRRIAYISGIGGYSFILKEQIWRKMLTEAGFAPPEQDFIKVENADNESGIENAHKAVRQYIQEGNRPTAIFTANDIIAMGTIEALRQENISIPQDISIMSHDNTVFASTLGLTSVDMKIRSVAIAAMDLLDYAISGNDTTPRHISITPSIVQRTSCKAI